FLNGRKQRRQMAETQRCSRRWRTATSSSPRPGCGAPSSTASYEDTIDLEIAEGVVTTLLRAAIREKVTTEEATEETVAEPADKDASENKPTIH
ncbi:preprotein translocase subunit YajC, partial [Pseudonocardia sp. ICBG601]|uniref:preprotein translocase subunit YajC n=1 Tax=Pseudonocardia sp. ICBG601 TaxID=2846759 RepID=UPI001CF67281